MVKIPKIPRTAIYILYNGHRSVFNGQYGPIFYIVKNLRAYQRIAIIRYRSASVRKSSEIKSKVHLYFGDDGLSAFKHLASLRKKKTRVKIAFPLLVY